MKKCSTILAVMLVAGACSGSESATSSTSTPPSTTSSTVTMTVEPTTTETTTSTTAVRTPSTEGWGTWTLILASLETGQPGAEDRAREIAAGIDRAAVLYSDDFPSLNPGYWVVHWGAFQSGNEASNWCSDQPDDLTCYPRFLGPDVSPLAADGHALVVDGDALVVIDVATGDRLKLFDPHFSGDGRYVGRMALSPDGSTLFYDVGWEDSWFTCESSRGQVDKLDLAFGTDALVGPGYAPAVSPDGLWMAVLDSEQCLPDPENPEFWVLTPTDTVVLYRLATGRPVETRRWSVTTAPTSYDDPQMVIWVEWRADSQSLLVMNNAGSVFEVNVDHRGPLDDGPPVVEGIDGHPQALIGETLYVTRDETPAEWGGFDLVAVDLGTGIEGEVIARTVGWAYAAGDTTKTRLIWGSDTQVGTAENMFELENYVGGLAW